VLKEVKDKRILAKDIPLPENKVGELFKQEEQDLKKPSPNHILIEGDNLHALTALTFTHEGKIDVIYIDPPYNTGNNDFKYHDAFKDEAEWIGKEHTFRHSTWLSFMNKRLKLAKILLKEDGVIFISIDENESHNLRVLLDELFGENNFIEQIVWNKRIPKNDKGIGNIHEYVLLYAKNYNSEHVFTQKKDGIEDVNAFVDTLKKRKITIQEGENEINKFYKKNGYDRGITLYNSFNEEFRLWGKINVSWPNAKTQGPRYDVLHPLTQKPCKVPDRGWRWTQDTFNSLLDYENVKKLYDGSFICGKIWFAKDENTQPSSIKFLDEVNDFLLRSIISTKSDGSNELIDIIGSSKFDYPKPVDLIYRLIASNDNKDLTVLDFFAGSGTTLQATMELNTEDRGNRQCILVTNNENNICEEVTYERSKKVIEGYVNAKGNQINGLTNNNLRYYKSEFVPSTKTELNKRLLTQASTELLQIKENCYIDITEINGFNRVQCGVFTDEIGKYMIVVYHSRRQNAVCEELIAYINTLAVEQRIKLYAFSPEKETLAADFADVADKIDALPLPDAIYNAYRATFRTLQLDRKLINPAEAMELDTEPELFDTTTEA
jgi:adenine-specific DNA-methyltransferase